MASSRPVLRLALFYTASFTVLGIHLPYFPVWLQARGLGPAEVGYVVAATIWARTLAGPLWAQAVDRSGRRAATLRGLALCGLVAYLPFAVLGTGSLWGYLAVAALFGACYPPIHSLLDHLTTRLGQRLGFAYGPVRRWGSLAFLVAAVAAGAALRGRDPELVWYLVSGALALTALTAWLLPDDDEPVGGPRRQPLRELLGSGEFLLFLAGVGLIQASHAAFYAFSAVHWQRAGIGEDVIGLLWAEGVLAEIALFSWSARLFAAVPAMALLAIGGAGAALRWVVLGQTTAVPALVAVQWLHALSFGCTHLAAVQHIALRVPQGMQASAQSLMGAVAMGGGMALSTMAAGLLYRSHRGGAFTAMAVLALLGTAAALLLARALAARDRRAQS